MKWQSIRKTAEITLPVRMEVDSMNTNQYTMPVLLDKEGEIGKRFQVTAIPTTVIINKHGMIKYRKSGAMTLNELEGIINSL